ncbi:hypothetical protein GOV09_06990 [Candidatus Woesearchaeota archaeon]|nr:hypothetical protein [Candidatus Woesearchaeota archaeon]
MRELFAKGKRGVVYLDDYKGERIIVKVKNPSSQAAGRIAIEADFLKKLNEKGIGPRFYYFKDDELGREFIDGEMFEDYLASHTKEEILSVLVDLFNQLFVMDQLKINKEEMHRPVKHILVRKDKPYLIDFERCHYTEKPQNITQFVQYLVKLSPQLSEKDVRVSHTILDKAKKYKKEQTLTSLKHILVEIS